MRNALAAICALLALTLALPAAAQETPKPMVDSYSALADSILALRAAEDAYVRSLLDSHRHAAESAANAGQWEAAAGHVAVFANEGDNAIAGVRKRLVEGGHHHNAAGEEQGIYDEGFVVVTREARKNALDLAAELRQAADDAARKAVWDRFAQLAEDVLSSE